MDSKACLTFSRHSGSRRTVGHSSSTYTRSRSSFSLTYIPYEVTFTISSTVEDAGTANLTSVLSVLTPERWTLPDCNLARATPTLERIRSSAIVDPDARRRRNDDDGILERRDLIVVLTTTRRRRPGGCGLIFIFLSGCMPYYYYVSATYSRV